MKIVADENISNLQEFFGHFGEVQAVSGRTLSSEQLRDADVLLVRSVTQVTAELLANSPVQFVGTCTIGTDHLDLNYLTQSDIVWASAPGCNAGGVVQYVLSVLATLMPEWRARRIGVIGSGNVGSRVCRALTALGVEHCAYDPFLTLADNPRLTDLATVLDCDAVCVHTPYTVDGAHPTHHLINHQTLSQLRPGAVLINAGRGGAVDNTALLAHLERGVDLRVALDVWENEPRIDLALLERVALGSPHIAGYSFEGRLYGSAMIFSALADHFGWEEERAQALRSQIVSKAMGPPQLLSGQALNQTLLSTYDPRSDDTRLREALRGVPAGQVGLIFDRLRKTYSQRREYGHHVIVDTPAPLAQTLVELGFQRYE